MYLPYTHKSRIKLMVYILQNVKLPLLWMNHHSEQLVLSLSMLKCFFFAVRNTLQALLTVFREVLKSENEECIIWLLSSNSLNKSHSQYKFTLQSLMYDKTSALSFTFVMSVCYSARIIFENVSRTSTELSIVALCYGHIIPGDKESTIGLLYQDPGIS